MCVGMYACIVYVCVSVCVYMHVCICVLFHYHIIICTCIINLPSIANDYHLVIELDFLLTLHKRDFYKYN